MMAFKGNIQLFEELVGPRFQGAIFTPGGLHHRDPPQHFHQIALSLRACRQIVLHQLEHFSFRAQKNRDLTTAEQQYDNGKAGCVKDKNGQVAQHKNPVQHHGHRLIGYGFTNGNIAAQPHEQIPALPLLKETIGKSEHML